jgi:hypothetical protein
MAMVPGTSARLLACISDDSGTPLLLAAGVLKHVTERRVTKYCGYVQK